MLREILREQIAIAPCRCLNPIVRGAIEALRDDPFVAKELKLELSGYRSLRAPADTA